MNQRVWAIRQKSTGHFLPHFKGRAGGSWVEPTPDCVPRLFRSARDARLSLGRWLEGHYKMTYTNRSGDIFGEDEWQELEVTPVEGRTSDDMEIVEFELVEVLN